MTNFKCFALLVFALCSTVRAQDSLWSRTYGGYQWDECRSARQTFDGGFVLAGPTNSFGAGSEDFWLIKTDASGDTEWTHTYGGELPDFCFSVEQTADSGFVLAGTTESFGEGWNDYWIVKTDPAGNLEWDRTFGRNHDDRCYAVCPLADGGYVLGGESHLQGGLYRDWIIRLTANGDSVWSRTFSGQSNEGELRAIVQRANGNLAVAGQKWFSGVDSRFWLYELSPEGDSLWSRTYYINGREYCHSMRQTIDGGFILAGFTSSEAGGQQACLLKTDSHGDSVWSRTYREGEAEQCYSVCQFSDGGYIMGGVSIDGDNDGDFCLVKTDSNGVEEWRRTYGRYFTDICYDVETTSDGGLIMAGVYAAPGPSCWLIKIDPTLSATREPPQLPDTYALTVFPNPLNPSTVFEMSIPVASPVAVKVYDILGREVETLVDRVMTAGIHRVNWNAEDVTSGTYLVVLAAPHARIVREAILLK